MRRRAFLGGVAAAGATIAAWPSWLQRAFAQDRPGAEDSLAVLSGAYRRAQRAGKPLLVIVIPADDAQKYGRGTAFGELLNFATDDRMALLAMCEVVCAPIASVRQLVPQLASRPAEPLMVLIETDAVPARVMPLDGPIAEPFDVPLGALIARGLASDTATVERRAAQVRARLGAAGVARIEAAITAGTLSPALADSAAALVTDYAQKAGSITFRNRLTAILAAAAVARLRVQRIAGSHWASSMGCGIDIEDTPIAENGMLDCGMGHSNPRSRRFLYFFVPRGT